MTDLLGIGASAIATYTNALAVVGDNVANAQTTGYARRDIVINEVSPAGGGSPYTRSSLGLGGSEATGISRAWDAFKSADALTATGEDGRASVTADWLDQAEDAIDTSDTGVGASITSVFTAGTTFAGDPTSATGRAQFYGALQNAAQAISGAGTRLATVSSGIGDAATIAVKSVNDDLSALAKINAAIIGTPDGSSAKAALADQRDQLLGDLAGQIGVKANIGSNGAATVTLSGTSGAVLLSGANASIVGVSAGGDGRLAFTLGLGANVTGIAPTSGALGGLAAAATAVAGQRTGLDTLATSFASQINGWNAAGTTADGKAGQPLLSATCGAAGLTVVASSADAIAAAGADGTANGNLLALANLRGSDGAEAQLATLVGTNAQVLASAKAQASAAATYKSAALTAQGDVNGVSLDQEAAELVRFQQAYDGSSKIIQAAQSSLQAILALF